MVRRKDNKGRVLQKGESQRKDGRYVYQYTDLQGTRKSIYAKNLSDLRKKKREAIRDLEDHIDTYGATITLNQLFDRYLSLKTNIRYSTRQNYTNMWNNNIKNTPLGNKQVGKIVKSDILKLYKNFSERGLKYSTICTFNGILVPAFDLALADDLIRKNPCIGCVKEFRKDDARERVALSRSQEREFVNYIGSSTIYAKHLPMIKVALKTGMRCGELIGLTWSDVDFDKEEISVNHQLVYRKVDGKYKFYAEVPKTKSGTRIIPMAKEVRRELLIQKQRQIMHGTTSKEIIDGYRGFCFTTKRRAPIMPSAVNNALYNIVNSYNKTVKDGEEKLPKISAHILRHTACTRMAESGMDVKVLQYIMGHNSINVTMEVYNHVSPERSREEMKKTENIRLII